MPSARPRSGMGTWLGQQRDQGSGLAAGQRLQRGGAERTGLPRVYSPPYQVGQGLAVVGAPTGALRLPDGTHDEGSRRAARMAQAERCESTAIRRGDLAQWLLKGAAHVHQRHGPALLGRSEVAARAGLRAPGAGKLRRAQSERLWRRRECS